MKKTALILAVIMIFSLISCTNMPIDTQLKTPSETAHNNPSKDSNVASVQTTPHTDCAGTFNPNFDPDALRLLNEALEKMRSCQAFMYEIKIGVTLLDDGHEHNTDIIKKVSVENFGKEDEKIRAYNSSTETSASKTTTKTEDIYCANGVLYHVSESGDISYTSNGTYNIKKDANPFRTLRELTGDFGEAEVTADEKNGGYQIKIHLGTGSFFKTLTFEEDVKEADYTLTFSLNSEGLPTKGKIEFRMVYNNDDDSDRNDTNTATVEVVFSYTDVKAQAPEGYLDYIKDHGDKINK